MIDRGNFRTEFSSASLNKALRHYVFPSISELSKPCVVAQAGLMSPNGHKM